VDDRLRQGGNHVVVRRRRRVNVDPGAVLELVHEGAVVGHATVVWVEHRPEATADLLLVTTLDGRTCYIPDRVERLLLDGLARFLPERNEDAVLADPPIMVSAPAPYPGGLSPQPWRIFDGNDQVWLLRLPHHLRQLPDNGVYVNLPARIASGLPVGLDFDPDEEVRVDAEAFRMYQHAYEQALLTRREAAQQAPEAARVIVIESTAAGEASIVDETRTMLEEALELRGCDIATSRIGSSVRIEIRSARPAGPPTVDFLRRLLPPGITIRVDAPPSIDHSIAPDLSTSDPEKVDADDDRTHPAMAHRASPGTTTASGEPPPRGLAVVITVPGGDDVTTVDIDDLEGVPHVTAVDQRPSCRHAATPYAAIQPTS
jgi:hypothetical protein